MQHVNRYRLTTLEVIAKLFFSDNKESAKNVTKSSKGLLEGRPLYNTVKYYQFTKKTADAFLAVEEAVNPPREDQLRRFYGVLAFCCLNGKTQRTRLRTSEIKEGFEEFASHIDLTNSDWYLDHDTATVRFGQIIVDRSTNPEALVNKCHKNTSEFLEVPGLKELIKEDLFVVSIITGNSRKQQAIIDHLKRKPLKVWTRVEFDKTLDQLLLQSKPK